MFKLYQWPTKRSPRTNLGRPKSKKYVLSQKRRLTVIEDLYYKGLLTETEYQAARWLVRAWHQNLSAIEAPRVKISSLDRLHQHNKGWSETDLKQICQDWRMACGVLVKQDRYTRKIVGRMLLEDSASDEVLTLRAFLRQLDERMSMLPK